MLFAQALELLAIAIRQTPQIKRFNYKQCETKLALYADDTVWFFESPVKSMAEFFRLVNKFGQVSGYKTNENKSISEKGITEVEIEIFY